MKIRVLEQARNVRSFSGSLFEKERTIINGNIQATQKEQAALSKLVGYVADVSVADFYRRDERNTLNENINEAIDNDNDLKTKTKETLKTSVAYVFQKYETKESYSNSFSYENGDSKFSMQQHSERTTEITEVVVMEVAAKEKVKEEVTIKPLTKG